MLWILFPWLYKAVQVFGFIAVRCDCVQFPETPELLYGRQHFLILRCPWWYSSFLLLRMCLFFYVYLVKGTLVILIFSKNQPFGFIKWWHSYSKLHWFPSTLLSSLRLTSKSCSLCFSKEERWFKDFLLFHHTFDIDYQLVDNIAHSVPLILLVLSNP